MSFTDNFEKFENVYNILKVKRYGNIKETIVAVDFRDRLEVERLEELEKGCFLHIKGEVYPIRAGLNNEKIKTTTQIKRIIITLLSSLKGNIFKKFFSIIYLSYSWQFYIDFIYHYLSDTFMDIDRYSQPVREIHRVVAVKFEKIAFIIMTILEFDLAYRYMFQDVIVEINKENFNKNPVKEYRRVLDILISKSYETLQNKFKLVKFMGSVALIFSKKLRKDLKEIVKELNLKELELSKEDIYWTNTHQYSSFKFRNLPYEIRAKQYLEAKINKTQ
jgi:hypothetical protein